MHVTNHSPKHINMKKRIHFLSLLVVMFAIQQVQAQCPAPTITGNQVLCANTTVTLTAQGSYTAYAWSNGATTQSATITTPGAYQVTVTCSNGSTAVGFANVLGYTTGIAVQTNFQNICAGNCAQVNVLLNNSGTTGPHTLVLDLSTGGTLTFVEQFVVTFFTITVCPTETTTYTIQSMTNSQGCVAFINPALPSTTVNVLGGNLSISGPPEICVGQSATLTAEPSNFPSYNWSNGQSGSSITVTSPGTYTVTASVGSGCTATATTTVASTPFTPPTITGGTTICPGSTLTLTAGGGTYTNYVWSSGQSGPSITVSSTGTYTVTVTSANGCTGTASQVVSPGSSTNTTILGPSNICPNASATLTATGNFSSYQWSSGQATPSIAVNSPGTYTVTVTDSGGCTGTASQTLGTSPLPSVSFSSGNPEVCAGDCLPFTVNFTGTAPFNLTYFSSVSGQQTQTFNSNTGTLVVCPPAGTPPGSVTLAAVSLSDVNCVCD